MKVSRFVPGDAMKQSAYHSSGPTDNQLANTSKERGNGAWGILSGKCTYQASSDASLFSSSLPVLPHAKFNSNDIEHSFQSVGDFSSGIKELHDNAEGNDSLEDTIGSLLPDDEEELLAGIADDFDLNGLPVSLEDFEESDIFDSGGGMEMELEPDTQETLRAGMSKVKLSDGVVGNGLSHYGLSNGVVSVAGEHPYGEHPSRTLFVRNINSNVEDLELKALFEQYGDIRTLYTACKHRGFVMISYYDIRAARTAMRALQNKPLRRRKLDIHFSIPKDNPSDKDINQGTLVVFNLDPSVSNEDLRQIFGAYGEVKEIRETPHKRHHKFIEFYDVRAADAALKSLNGCDIAGKRIKLEPSRPGGARRNSVMQPNQELEQDESWNLRHPVGSPITISPPGKWIQYSSPIEHCPMKSFSRSPGFRTQNPNSSIHFSGLASILHPQAPINMKVAPLGKDPGRGHMDHIITHASSNQASAFQQPHSFPELKLSQFHETLPSFGTPTSNASGIETLSGSQFLWGSPSPYSECSSSSAWPKPSVGNQFVSSTMGHAFPLSGCHGPFGQSQHCHLHPVGSAPSGVPLDRHFGHFTESTETTYLNPVAFGGMRLGPSDGKRQESIAARTALSGLSMQRNLSENGSSNFKMMSSPRFSPIFLGNTAYPGLFPTSIDGLTEFGRSTRLENNAIQVESKKQFELELEKIKSGDDTRTTLMIKNIPNKYTSKMLLAAIDENHNGTYDFLYLPIDFKNKCNVGYAFINMLSPSHIIPFYETFHGKKWEKFNSEKVASLAYARIQGKAALVAHFQNSSLMNEDKRCRPILLHSNSTEAGDQITQEHLPFDGLKVQTFQLKESKTVDSSAITLKVHNPSETSEKS